MRRRWILSDDGFFSLPRLPHSDISSPLKERWLPATSSEVKAVPLSWRLIPLFKEKPKDGLPFFCMTICVFELPPVLFLSGITTSLLAWLRVFPPTLKVVKGAIALFSFTASRRSPLPRIPLGPRHPPLRSPSSNPVPPSGPG